MPTYPSSVCDQAVSAPSQYLISIVIPTFNSSRELTQCLEAAAAIPCACEILVIDDCSTENIRPIAERYGARYLRTPRNAGPAAARNLGVKHSHGEILVFIDADVVPPSNTLHVIIEEFEAHPEVSALFGSYDDAPACGNFWSQFKNLMHHHVHQSSDLDACTFWAGCGAIRKEAFEAVGGFDAFRYPTPSIEDIDLGVRLTQQGLRIRLVKQLQAKHLKRWTLRSTVHTDLFKRAVPWTQLIRQTGSLPESLNLTWAARVSSALVGTIALLAIGVIGSLAPSGFPRNLFLAGIFVSAAVLFVLNTSLYRFFFRKKKLGFACGAVLAHCFYLLYSGAAFILCYAAGSLIDLFRWATEGSSVGLRGWLGLRSHTESSLENEGDI